jgi:Pyruvate/2-oxoacid:ferredoxin oxidoreductase delta subunit
MNIISFPVDKNFRLKKLLLPILIATVFWTLAVTLYVMSGELFPLINFGYLGTSLAVGLGLYAILPKQKKPIGRRISLLLVGLYLFIFVGIFMQENIQIEGVWWSLINGTFYAAIWHYMVAKIIGPLLFGRLWCGWACWSVMIFDLLPYKRSAGRLDDKWGRLRYVHLLASFLFVYVAWRVFNVQYGSISSEAVVWFLVGNALYYLVGIAMAVKFKDNRAFCKYLCPVAVPLKLTSRFSILKIKTDNTKCNDCRACEKMCPMDIQITDYVHAEQRVLSTECTLCQTCVTVCAKDALKLAPGFDRGGRDAFRYRQAPAGKLDKQNSRAMVS